MSRAARDIDAPPPVRDVAWHWLRCRLPAEWECTGFNRSSREGRLEFGTRHGFEGQVAWRVCAGVPDESRILNDIHRRYLELHDPDALKTFKKLEHRRLAGFLVAHDQPGHPLQAAKFFRDSSVLIQWLFPKYDEAKIETAIEPILKTVEPNAGAMRQWALLGLDFRLPERFKLTNLAALPIHVAFSFEEAGPGHVLVQRWALPEMLLRGQPLETFLRANLVLQDKTVTEVRERKLFGCRAAEADYTFRAVSGWDRWSLRPWKGRASLWLREDEQRLYCFEHWGAAKTEAPRVSDVFTLEKA